MSQEPQKGNNVLIIVAIISVVGTIIASVIGVIGNYNTEKLRQESALTQIAIIAIATQGGATQASMTSTPLPTTSTPVKIVATAKPQSPDKNLSSRIGESIIGIVFIIIFLFILWAMKETVLVMATLIFYLVLFWIIGRWIGSFWNYTETGGTVGVIIGIASAIIFLFTFPSKEQAIKK